MIYDAFAFNNELDLLEIRLNELDPIVDRFVLVEAELTHNGDAKPLYYEANKERFSRFADKIIHIVVSKEDFAPAESGDDFQHSAWMRENIQRNAVARAFPRPPTDDIVMVSDLDEIPCAEAVRRAIAGLKAGEVVGLALNAYAFFMNLRNISDPIWGNDPKIAKAAMFWDEGIYAEVKYNRFIVEQVNKGASATKFRYVRPVRRIGNAGWHFSYMGGIDAVIRKIKSFNELGFFRRDNLREMVEERIKQGLAFWGDERFLPEKSDAMQYMPQFVIDNLTRFGRYFVEAPAAYGIKQRLLIWWSPKKFKAKRFVWGMILNIIPVWVRNIVKRCLKIYN